ncbi:MAG: TetR/AcrR family transcriptional regulator [Caulobacterales bacterium]
MAKKADHSERREIFAAAALRVIMRAGVGGLTVREVAKEAGFTTGALTHYFTSKDQVLIEASEYAAKLVRPRMERSAREESAIQALRKVIADALPTTRDIRGLWRIWLGFWERSSYNPDVARVMRARYEEWRGRLAVLIRRAQSQGEMPGNVDPDLAAQELVALIDGISVQVLLGSGRIPAARQREIIDTWVDTLVAGRAGRPVRKGARAG